MNRCRGGRQPQPNRRPAARPGAARTRRPRGPRPERRGQRNRRGRPPPTPGSRRRRSREADARAPPRVALATGDNGRRGPDHGSRARPPAPGACPFGPVGRSVEDDGRPPGTRLAREGATGALRRLGDGGRPFDGPPPHRAAGGDAGLGPRGPVRRSARGRRGDAPWGPTTGRIGTSPGRRCLVRRGRRLHPGSPEGRRERRAAPGGGCAPDAPTRALPSGGLARAYLSQRLPAAGPPPVGPHGARRSAGPLVRPRRRSVAVQSGDLGLDERFDRGQRAPEPGVRR